MFNKISFPIQMELDMFKDPSFRWLCFLSFSVCPTRVIVVRYISLLGIYLG